MICRKYRKTCKTVLISGSVIHFRQSALSGQVRLQKRAFFVTLENQPLNYGGFV